MDAVLRQEYGDGVVQRHRRHHQRGFRQLRRHQLPYRRKGPCAETPGKRLGVLAHRVAHRHYVHPPPEVWEDRTVDGGGAISGADQGQLQG